YRATKPHVRFEYGVSGMAWAEVGTARSFLARNPKDPGMIATRFVLEKSLVAIQAGAKPPASAEDGRDVPEGNPARYHSATTGHRVSVADAAALGLAGMRMGAV